MRPQTFAADFLSALHLPEDGEGRPHLSLPKLSAGQTPKARVEHEAVRATLRVSRDRRGRGERVGKARYRRLSPSGGEDGAALVSVTAATAGSADHALPDSSKMALQIRYDQVYEPYAPERTARQASRVQSEGVSSPSDRSRSFRVTGCARRPRSRPRCRTAAPPYPPPHGCVFRLHRRAARAGRSSRRSRMAFG